MQLKTIFSDLLPADDPYVQVYQDHPNFGSPLTLTLMIENKNGDIYNPTSLQKVWDLTREIDLAPGVDHDQILSLASSKARFIEATPYGIDVRPLMDDKVPQTPDEIAEFKERVERSPNANTFLVAKDGSAAIVTATFIERLLDYGDIFKYATSLIEKHSDDEHVIHMAGQPALTGWVYHLEGQMFWIFGVTLSALVLFLVLYMKNVVGVITPIVTSAVAAIWGFGLTGWIGAPIEPLLMIVPLLLVARSFSHCVQFVERYYEIYEQVHDKGKAAELTMGVMLAPSVLGILTDAFGILLISVAPIPAMERFAYFCGFWAISMIPTGVVLISLMLAALPKPSNIDKLVSGKNGGMGAQAILHKILLGIASLSSRRHAKKTGVVISILAVFSIYTALQIKIGNPVEGSNLLWPNSEFNTAVSEINSRFPGVNTLEIILESKDPGGEVRVARQAETVAAMLGLQSLLESSDQAPRASLSFADYMSEGNRLFSGGNPKWLPLDSNDRATNAAANAVMMGSSAKAFSHVTDFEQQHATVSFWYKDNKQETVDAALAAANAAVEKVGRDHDEFSVRLGTGTIALQQATNNVVSRYHWIIIGLLNLFIFVSCSYAYRTPVAALMLMIPVNLSTFMLNATMHLLGIGLDINSLMVAAIGVGVGIDYGIYLLSRICEEFDVDDHDIEGALTRALTTTGKAILFTASIMLVSIVPWYFLADLKFMADMGLLLTLIMLVNMALALIVLPLLVMLIRPKFLYRHDLLVGEKLDLDVLKAANTSLNELIESDAAESRKVVC
ncbi:efflux RND transporter permease subunit [Zhongshania marina]|uniref:efflux RND transporter permease subunit n=1 Tax=Zhongshania marina TaxID=2304603 RepID=UPI001E3F327D|nr:MMPL family transporter [Marortus luteolus]